ncbi:MAG TPA: Uma2 family endonuclease [Actinoplanes sp.]|jgi:Uma2 family endonuclease|nr:Uma2 family endonuclease [Actinoplanes sp.]
MRDVWHVEKPATTFWHKAIAGRLLSMRGADGAHAFDRPALHGDNPGDYVLPDIGVITRLPPDRLTCSALPGSAFTLVAEIVDLGGDEGERADKMDWYAQRGIPEYWIADQAPDRSDDDALVIVHRLESFGGKSVYQCERSLLLSELEAEYRAG